MPISLDTVISGLPPSLPTTLPFSIPPASLTEIYSPPHVGKTSLLLTLSIHACIKGSVVLIDSEGAITPQRIAQLCLAHSITSDRIHILRIVTWEHIVAISHLLPSIISRLENCLLIGIDSLTSLYRTCMQEAAPKRLEALAGRLRSLAVDSGCAIVVTNHARVVNNCVVSAMGEAWRYVCGTRFCLRKERNDLICERVKSAAGGAQIFNCEITEWGFVINDC